MADAIVVRDTGGVPDQRGAAIARWWKEKDPGPAMVAAAKAIYDSPQERSRRRADLIFARMHSGRPLASIYDYGSAFRMPYVTDPYGYGQRTPLNVVQAVIEAIAAKLAKNKPRPLVLTEGGDWTLQRQAKGLTKFLDGLNRACNLYRKGRKIFRDCGAFGTGIFSLYEDRQKALIGVERTLPIEMIIDDQEAARGCPQSKYVKKPIYRGALLDMFGAGRPEVRAIIEQAKGYSPAGYDGRVSDMLPVFEGWHLNGSHVIALEEGTLFDEDWPFDWYPDVMINWREPDSGVWGLGAAENLLPIQYEISRMLERFQRAMALGAKMWIFRPPGGPQKAQVSNEQMTILDAEQPLQFAAPDPMPTQAYQYLWDLYAKAFEIEGVSQLSATGTKPAGLDAAVAIREFNDVQTERFVLLGQDLEDAYVEIAEKEIKLSKRMYKRGRSIVVRSADTKLIERINFADVDIDEERSTVGIFPTSSLPTTPAARLQTIKEYYESGLIPDRQTALSLLDFPDLQEVLSLELSAIEDVKRILEKILDKGKYETPEPYMDLKLALRMGQASYLRARNDGVSEKRKDLLLRFIDDVNDLLTEITPPAQTQPAMLAPDQPNPQALMPAAPMPGAPAPPEMASAA